MFIADQLKLVTRATEKAERLREELTAATTIFREVRSGAREGDASFEKEQVDVLRESVRAAELPILEAQKRMTHISQGVRIP